MSPYQRALLRIEEQDSAADRGIPRRALDDLIHPVDEQGPVGEAGQRVVQRVVLELELRGALVGDVGHRTSHPGRAPAGTADRQPAREHPPPAAIGVTHAMLGLQMGRAAHQVGLDRRAQARHVLSVHQVEPR